MLVCSFTILGTKYVEANWTTIAQAAYYIARTCDYAAGRKNCDGAPAPIAPPKGLRMVVGDPYLR